jgi:hypothetical protein
MKAIKIKCGDLAPNGYRGNYCPKCIKARIVKARLLGVDVLQ